MVETWEWFYVLLTDGTFTKPEVMNEFEGTIQNALHGWSLWLEQPDVVIGFHPEWNVDGIKQPVMLIERRKET